MSAHLVSSRPRPGLVEVCDDNHLLAAQTTASAAAGSIAGVGDIADVRAGCLRVATAMSFAMVASLSFHAPDYRLSRRAS
jgi:hypothetical protein